MPSFKQNRLITLILAGLGLYTGQVFAVDYIYKKNITNVSVTSSSGTNGTTGSTGGGTGQGVLEASTGSNTITFGSVNIGATSATQTVQLLNSGNIPLTVQSLTTSGDFTYSAPNCTTLNAGTTCNVDMAMMPTASGQRNGVFTVTSDGGNLSINLTGTGQANISSQVSGSVGSVTTANGAIGTVSLNSPSYATYYVLTAGDVGTLTSNFSVSGTGFTIDSVGKINTTGTTGSCGATVSSTSATNCVADAVKGTLPNTYVRVKFLPTAAQNYTGTLTLTNNGTATTVNLTGTGTNIGITNFGSYFGWSDGTYAQSCNLYLRPGSGYLYTNTGNGIYRIQPTGQAATDVYCDMTTYAEADGSIGGWTLVATAMSATDTTYIPNGNAFGTPPRATDTTGVHKFSDSFIGAIPSKQGLMVAGGAKMLFKYGTTSFKGWPDAPSYVSTQAQAPLCYSTSKSWIAGRQFHIVDCWPSGTPLGNDGVVFKTSSTGARFTHSPGAYTGTVWVK